MTKSVIFKKMDELVARSAFELRADVRVALEKAARASTDARAKNTFKLILENAAIARKDRLAICQDTGLPVVFVEVGKNAKVDAALISAIEDGIAAAYKKHSLRASTVDPLKRGSSFYSGGITHVEFDESVRGIRVSILPKGFGSENKSMLKMFNPTASISDIEDFVVEAVKKAGPESCPPFVIGIGIGGTSDHALLLAKKAFLSDISKTNADKQLATIEKSLFKKLNALNIGPMGYGGGTSVLAVKALKSPTHIAGLPVGVNISCHALRSASVVL
jgi:fumarate hydratase subunit alpha